MKVVAVNNQKFEETGKTKGAAKRIKRLMRKVVKASTLDASPVFKSREWPYL